MRNAAYGNPKKNSDENYGVSNKTTEIAEYNNGETDVWRER